MVDLIRPQIHEGCRLALPEGLQDLMSDISREVLRAQPVNIYKFIADYLSALMVARENLFIASRLCDQVCTSQCNPELEDELRYLGLDDEVARKANEIITDYFKRGEVNEQSLLIKIAKKTKIDGTLLPAVQAAIRKAFKRHLLNITVIYQSSSDSDLDEVARAAKHTLHLYRKTKHAPEEYTRAAAKIQTAYRAYGVRRNQLPPPKQASRQEKKPEKNLLNNRDPHPPSEEKLYFKACLSVSSTSLAGSYLNLPKSVPYSVHAPDLLENDELEETESTCVYLNQPRLSSTTGHKKISFQVNANEIIEDKAVLADDESETSVEEVIIAKKKTSDDDNEVVLNNVDVNKDDADDVNVSNDNVDDTFADDDEDNGNIADDEVANDDFNDAENYIANDDVIEDNDNDDISQNDYE